MLGRCKALINLIACCSPRRDDRARWEEVDFKVGIWTNPASRMLCDQVSTPGQMGCAQMSVAYRTL
ncbi:hypothetical protein SAMN05216420_11062 [Nitrosospira sp. Nl5]|nr:hypothetical protein SAMN05216420_11062 [Nitrosospira sp. Nl5]